MSAPATSATSESSEEQSTAAESRRIRRRSLGLLRSLLRPVAGAAWWTAALVVGAQLAAVAGPALVAYGIDQALPALTDGDAGPITLATAAYLAAALLGGLLTAATVRASARVSQTMLLDLRRRVFRHTQRLSLEFHESYTSGRIISRQTSDVDALRELLDGGVTTLASGVLAMVFTAVSLVLLDWRSGLVLLIAVVPGVMLTRWFQVRSQVQYRKQRTAAARLIVRFVETMTGIRAVQAFRREPQVREVYGDLAEDYRGHQRHVDPAQRRLRHGADPDRERHGRGGAAGRRAACARRRHRGRGARRGGALRAAVLQPARADRHVLQLLPVGDGGPREARVAARRGADGARAGAPASGSRDARGDVRFDDVEFGYGTGPTVLPHVDLHIPAGQSIALVGETGAGKSTIAKLLARFYDVRERLGPPRRARPARDRPGRPAAGRRDGDPGGVPVLRLARGEHRARQAGGHARGDRGGRARGRRARPHRGDARRVRHRGRQARRAALGRASVSWCRSRARSWRTRRC